MCFILLLLKFSLDTFCFDAFLAFCVSCADEAYLSTARGAWLGRTGWS